MTATAAAPVFLHPFVAHRSVSVVPLMNIMAEDVCHTAALGLDGAFKEITANVLGLDTLAAAVPPRPVLGESTALVSAVKDLLEWLMPKADIDAQSKESRQMQQARYAREAQQAQQMKEQALLRLAVDLIALPPPDDTAAARMALRTMLHGVGQRKATRLPLTDTLIERWRAHVNDTLRGEIDTFVVEAKAHLPAVLQQAGTLAAQFLKDIAAACTHAEAGGAAPAPAKGAQPTFWHDPRKVISAPWKDLALQARAANSPGAQKPGKLNGHALYRLRDLKQRCLNAAGTISGLVSAQNGPLQELLNDLQTALISWRAKQEKNGVPFTVPVGRRGKVERRYSEGELGAISGQAPAVAAPNPCKNRAPTGTGGSIGFALGDETLHQTDFTLPGGFPLSWNRVYNSRRYPLDTGPLGARWSVPWTARIDIAPGYLLYHAPDGRSLGYRRLAVGEAHRDPVENLALTVVDQNTLTLTRGAHLTETFRYVAAVGPDPEHYRLERVDLKSGFAVALDYRRHPDGREPLSALRMLRGDAVLHHLATEIDDAGRIRAVHLVKDDKHLRTLARYTYDGNGDLVAAEDEHGHIRTYQYRRHLITRYTDKSGRGMNLEWDGPGPLSRAVREHADDGTFDTRLAWHPHLRQVSVTDAEGGVTVHHFDLQGYTTHIAYADGGEEWYFRDADENLLRHLRPDGREDAIQWNQRGQPIRHIKPGYATTWYEYDDKDRLVALQDPENGIWRRDVDAKGNVLAETDPLGHITEYAYNPFNLPVEITDAKGGKKQIAYTETGQIQTFTDCSGKTTAWAYDERGRLKSVANAAGQKTEYRYGEAPIPDPKTLDSEEETRRVAQAKQNTGHLESIKHSDGSIEQFLHDPEGRLLQHTDPSGKKTAWTYTAAGLVQTRRDALGHTLHYRWDKLGRLVALVNQNGEETRFKYDPVGRLLEETGFDGQKAIYRYRRDNGEISSIERGDTRHEFSFDAAGRLEEKRACYRQPDGQWSAPVRIAYGWDGNNHLIEARNPASRLTWFYDLAGNLTTEQQHYFFDGQGADGNLTAVWRHAYDPLGNRIATIRPDGHRVEHLVYGSGHIHGLILDGIELLSFERDDLHREIERTLKNGLTHTQGYDPLGRLQEQTLVSDRGQLVQRKYAYDRAGRLNKIDDSHKGERTYRYDPVGKLLEAATPLGTERFVFDPAGNPLKAEYAPPQRGNLLPEHAEAVYRHDACGNRREKKTLHGDTRYIWNSWNQLVEVVTPTARTRFAYDALGRRIMKRSEPLISSVSGAGSQYEAGEKRRLSRELGLGITYYGWEGDRLSWESGPQGTFQYFYLPGSFVPVLQTRQKSAMKLHQTPDWTNRDYRRSHDPLWTEIFTPEPFESLGYYHCDQIGTPQEITDETGKIVWSAKYKAWGEAKETTSEFRNPLRFLGQYHDHETGLHYNRHRYYDPEVGRYLNQDPIGLAGGVNPYAYAPNPIHWADPLGLEGGVWALGNPFEGKGADLNLNRIGDSGKWGITQIPKEPNVFKLGAHGGSNYINDDRSRFLEAQTTKTIWYYPEKPQTIRPAAEMIRSHKNYREGMIVELNSCETGRDGDASFAQGLANELGTIVCAPNKYVWIVSDGSTPVAGRGPDGKRSTDDVGEMKIFYPK